MAERSAAVMNALLAMHRARDPLTLLRGWLTHLAPDYGVAVVCCYLLDQAGGEYRLEFLDDATGEAGRALQGAGLQAPAALAWATAAPVLSRLADTGDPVHVADQLPEFLVELGGTEPVAGIAQGLAMRFCAFAPVCSTLGTTGFLVMIARDPWPLDVAAECTAHAAVALANLVERRATDETDTRHPQTGLLALDAIEQLGARELSRAGGTRQTLALVVIEPPSHAASDEVVYCIEEAIARVKRQSDAVARLGASRFVVLLPETVPGGTEAFIRRVRQQAGERLTGLRGGAATFPHDGRTWEDLLRAAVTRLDEPSHGPAAMAGDAPIQSGLRAAFPTFGAVPYRPLGRAI
jgi:GGDEF domain-containing protein